MINNPQSTHCTILTKMKKILIFLIPILIIGGGTALALTMQDDPICAEPRHTGYTLEGGASLPDASTFDPEATLPTGMVNEGQYGPDFDCEENLLEKCHWAYIPASGSNQARWVQCDGKLVRN